VIIYVDSAATASKVFSSLTYEADETDDRKAILGLKKAMTAE
jgi:hypothetical protein